MKLSPNSLTFIALSNEYCQAIEHAADVDRDYFVAQMLQLLPRIYIVASDVETGSGYSDCYIDSQLDEDTYLQAREVIARLMADDDVYLEVMVEDMKYSDMPIATSVSENLSDLYQEFYNFVASARDMPTDTQQELVEVCKENFCNYWSQTLCNVMRALNNIYYQSSLNNDY